MPFTFKDLIKRSSSFVDICLFLVCSFGPMYLFFLDPSSFSGRLRLLLFFFKVRVKRVVALRSFLFVNMGTRRFLFHCFTTGSLHALFFAGVVFGL